MNNKWLPWILTAMITVLIAVFGYTVNRMDTAALAAQQIYMTKDQYNKDQSEVCDRLADIQLRIDRNDEKSEVRVQKIIELLMKQDKATVKRDKARD